MGCCGQCGGENHQEQVQDTQTEEQETKEDES